MRIFLTIMVFAMLAGCATTPPVTGTTAMCGFKQQPLIVDDPDKAPGGSSANGAAAGAAASNPPPAVGPLQAGPGLILSGGSQNGAFGAGFLTRWGELSPGGKLPKFDLVTGISTGAILATWAFIGEPETIAGEYRIKHESQLLDVYRRPSKNGKIGLGAALTLIRKNSLADLGPLRKRLREVLDYNTLRNVAGQAGRLTIAAVDVDTGNAVLFDMKDMAVRATRAMEKPGGGKEFEFLRNCYAEAVLASSSVPLGAKPVFIDNRMYIDGGARYGVFVDYLSEASARHAAAGATPAAASAPSDAAAGAPATKPDAPRLFILVNGTQWVKESCGKIDDSVCKNPLDPDPFDRFEGGHRPWEIGGLAFRSNDILINQVYRLSAARVSEQYRQQYPAHLYQQHFYFARMHRHDLYFRRNFEFKEKSCRDWLKHDKEALNPFEFYPNYMHCIEEYGKKQAEKLEWYRPDRQSDFDLDLAY